MTNQLQYRSTIKSRPFLYIETKKLAELMLQGLNDLEIKEQVIHQNIFQVKSETRKRDIAAAVRTRLQSLDDYLLERIVKAHTNTSKYIVLYAIAKTDRLFYEFLLEVIGDKFVYKDLILQPGDFNIFFEAKRQQSEHMAYWKPYTFYKLQQVYTRILYEAGLIKKDHNQLELVVPFVEPDVIEHLRKIGSERFLEATMQGGTS
ncbi:hypothetical protein JNUCC1_02259 [Lentibacillus sp. JNUCC-1]|uniref:DUF1819 family protein n=1 Tax=Lentibacillus sp. JNUCC-1 TaxID=2654513 RepID=UPI0012E8C28A|nr:DUF1819 family protein [Lentibacillus sp. JNUCC-1]MUV38421.1 hypothetical protein [Lentibacillus sp. JNUCC-1]